MVIILHLKNSKYRGMVANTIIDMSTIHHWEIIRNINMIYKSFAGVCDSGGSFDYLTQLYICSEVDPRRFKFIVFFRTENQCLYHPLK